MDYAFQYAVANGMCTEDSYPYTAQDGSCQTSCTKVVNIASYVDVAQDNEDALQAAVALNPVSVAVEADQAGFQFYTSGVFTGSCGTALDHGVLAVGYGTTSSGQKYWKVKNSWGASWGESGYIRLIRNKNECGINQMASYPVSN